MKVVSNGLKKLARITRTTTTTVSSFLWTVYEITNCFRVLTNTNADDAETRVNLKLNNRKRKENYGEKQNNFDCKNFEVMWTASL